MMQPNRADAPPDEAEDRFARMVPRATRRRLGQFFTPVPIAALMADWIAGANPASVLDPAVGPGRLLAAAQARCPNAQLLGYDIDPLCLSLAKGRLAPAAPRLTQADFLLAPEGPKVDAILANPPYLRRRDLPYRHDIHAAFRTAYGLPLSGLSPVYVLFLLKALDRLAPGGRAAFLIPSDWANANFGQPLKRYLADHGALRHVLHFDANALTFDDNLSTASVLLFDAGGAAPLVRTYHIPAPADHLRLSAVQADPAVTQARFAADDLARAPKWDRLIAAPPASDLPGLVPLGQLVRTKRGIATGANAFFHLTAAQAARAGLREDQLLPCIGKAKAVPGLCLTAQDFADQRDRGTAVYLLNLTQADDPAAQAYLAQGVAAGVDQRYLTRRRRPWHAPEPQEIAPIWAATFGRDSLRFVRNRAGLRCLTAFHCLYPLDPDPDLPDALVACLNAPLIQQRARAQSRAFGGGLRKVEPRDVLDIAVPDLRLVPGSLRKALAKALHDTDAAYRAKAPPPPGLDALVRAAAQAAAGAESRGL